MTHSSNQSQSIGNISIDGSVSGSELFNFNQNQATGDAKLNQIRSDISISSSDLQAALEAIQQLKQDITTATALNPVQKTMMQAPTSILEAELQKSKPDKNLIEQTIEALRQGLQGVEILAEPVMRVSALVAQALLLL